MQNPAAESSNCPKPAQRCQGKTKNCIIFAFNKDKFKQFFESLLLVNCISLSSAVFEMTTFEFT